MIRILLAQNNVQNSETIKKALSDKASEIEYVEVELGVGDIIRGVEMLKPDVLFVTYEAHENVCFKVMEQLIEKKILGEETKEKKLYVVVTSERDEYDVVRNAFKLGAQDYIIEPLDTDEVTDAIEQITQKVLSDKIKRLQKDTIERKMLDYNVLLEHTFFYNIMFNEDFDRDVSNVKTFTDNDEKGFIITFEIKTSTSGDDRDYIEFQKKIRSKLQKNMKIKMGPMINGKLCVYVKCESLYMSDKVKRGNFLYWTAKEICDLMVTELKVQVCAGVGGVYPIKDICSSYEESLRALTGCEGVCVYKEKMGKKEDFGLYKEKVQKLMESIEMGSRECFNDFSRLLESMEGVSEEEKYNRVLLILTFVTCAVKKYALFEPQTKNYVGELKKNLALRPEDINLEATKRFNNLIKNEKRYNLKKYSEYVKFCVDYIHENYQKDIVLKEVSNMCGVSMQYLSKMFREETGMNFVEFINDCRIKKAKELLVHSKVPVKEVCFEVGYNDPNYFSRVFKKNTGKTPREYIYEYSSNQINSTD